ncbi:peptide deformylase [Amycolatopsis sp. FDAARGOS 1241]|uniref:peptide deformylase n=1 Tax=Amycolatopsis sp. FDAARGOS 1241 TaxID=2778070 RepID=UPI0019505EB2|nr:peptide deformylase [Amycolatopsis sp. FDAARGOS 1241]QRP47648.1 peptide deformylase [Amycolatopsis sp. FDAARGOS 1241]
MLADLVETLLAQPLPWPIVQAGDPVLRTPAAPYEGELSAAALAGLIEGMKETMHAAPGVGLAAPQVGLPVQLAVVEDRAHERPVPAEVLEARGIAPLPFRVLVNPRYTPLGAERAAFFEGCLSVSGWQAVVARPLRVRLQALDETGAAVDEELSGWPARIVQHETDHLAGMLYLDRAELRSLSTHQAVSQRWAQPTAELAAKELGFDLP